MSGDPTGIPLDIQGELAKRGLSGKLTVNAEELPNGGSLSAGTNKGDGIWSLELDELSGLRFIAPPGQTGGHTLTIRVLRLRMDSEGFAVAATVALFDMRLGDDAEAAPAAQAKRKSKKERSRRDEKAEKSEMDQTFAKSVAGDQRLTMRLMAQWHELRGKRRCPLASEFLSSLPPELSPDCFIFVSGKTLDEGTISLGSDIMRNSGLAKSSLSMAEVSGNTLLGAAMGSLKDALKGKPIPDNGEFEDAKGQSCLYRAILLPLEDDEGEIVQVIGGARCKVRAKNT